MYSYIHSHPYSWVTDTGCLARFSAGEDMSGEQSEHQWSPYNGPFEQPHLLPDRAPLNAETATCTHGHTEQKALTAVPVVTPVRFFGSRFPPLQIQDLSLVLTSAGYIHLTCHPVCQRWQWDVSPGTSNVADHFPTICFIQSVWHRFDHEVISDGAVSLNWTIGAGNSK